MLRDRLASYYNQPLGYTRKMDGLLQSVREIETRVLGSELEALLVESRLIKELQPRYNVQLRNYELYPFIKVDVQHRLSALLRHPRCQRRWRALLRPVPQHAHRQRDPGTDPEGLSAAHLHA